MALAVNIIPPEGSRPIVLENLTQHDVFREWARQITEEVNLRSVRTGVGSPEGVIKAIATVEYMDTTGAASNIKYIKQVDDIAGDKTLGWILT